MDKNKQIILHKSSKEIEEVKIPKTSNIESSLLDDQEEDTKTKIHQISLNILNILSDAALKEAEKVSCQSGCKNAQQVYLDTMHNLLSPINKDKKDKEDTK